MKSIIFVVESAIYANDGYKSRIEMEMDLLSQFDCEYILLAPSEDKEIVFRHKVEIIKYKAFSSKIPFIFNYAFLINKLNKLIKEKDNPIIYCEALPSAVICYKTAKKRKCKLVYDCHGTAPDEVYLYHPNLLGKIYANWLRKEQINVVEKCDELITVTHNQYLEFNTQKKYILLPMLPSEHFFDSKNYREKIRNDLNIELEKIVFCYSGQAQKWQMTNQTIEFYSKIEKEFPNAFLLILTKDSEAFKKLINKYNIKNYCIKTIEYVDMPKYLDVADYGFCLRENHIINRVASPTKILEYLARNVTPIITPYVGDFSDYLQEKGACCIIRKFDPSEINLNNYQKETLSLVTELKKLTSEAYKKSVKDILNL